MAVAAVPPASVADGMGLLKNSTNMKKTCTTTERKHKKFGLKTEAVQAGLVNKVVVPWHQGQDGFWWNETCAMVIEVFGLPGEKFVYSPQMDYMTFYFKSNKDANLCRILLSERI